jgi:hypothetical protein
VAAQLAVSQEGLSSMELVILKTKRKQLKDLSYLLMYNIHNLLL